MNYSIQKMLFHPALMAFFLIFSDFSLADNRIAERDLIDLAEFVLSGEISVIKESSHHLDLTGIDLDSVYKEADEMPRFPGCENASMDILERKSCADQKMLEFVFKNILYPEEARIQGIEGQVVAKFIVNKDGWLEEIEMVRSLGGGLDEEVIRVIELMNKMEERWIPGKVDGENVNVQFYLPVRFTLNLTKRERRRLNRNRR